MEGTADGCKNREKRDTFAAQTSDKGGGQEVRGQDEEMNMWVVMLMVITAVMMVITVMMSVMGKKDRGVIYRLFPAIWFLIHR